MKKLLLIAFILQGCGTARTDDLHIEILTAPDGATCYAVVQAGQAKGGNCK